jgi:hypothetical protein
MDLPAAQASGWLTVCGLVPPNAALVFWKLLPDSGLAQTCVRSILTPPT